MLFGVCKRKDERRRSSRAPHGGGTKVPSDDCRCQPILDSSFSIFHHRVLFNRRAHNRLFRGTQCRTAPISNRVRCEKGKYSSAAVAARANPVPISLAIKNGARAQSSSRTRRKGNSV